MAGCATFTMVLPDTRWSGSRNAMSSAAYGRVFRLTRATWAHLRLRQSLPQVGFCGSRRLRYSHPSPRYRHVRQMYQRRKPASGGSPLLNPKRAREGAVRSRSERHRGPDAHGVRIIVEPLAAFEAGDVRIAGWSTGLANRGDGAREPLMSAAE
jgi:hypothetical protein